jgi:predicted ATPase
LDNANEFQVALAKVMKSPALVTLHAASTDVRGNVVEARYSTQAMVTIERDMAANADRMVGENKFGVARQHVVSVLFSRPFLVDEQTLAIEHVTGSERLAAVVGLAGAGKSTLLAAAREAWEAAGYRVHGAALSGKAAEGLEESAGIASRTLTSWERGWERGFDVLGSRDVFVIDEAGMVGSVQLSRFITEADRAGAKVVLVGDPEQLQPIGPGAAFRAVAERVGFVELETVRRQRADWQREASVDFGRHRTAKGLEAYAERGAVRLEAFPREAMVREVLADMSARPEGSRLVLAHRCAEVQALNEGIRSARQARGELSGERGYRTTEGERCFAVGDRLLFRENNRDLGVKNGMLGTVERTSEGHLEVRLDAANGKGRMVSVSMADYAAVDHGYAITIHKAQGVTVDRAYVLASSTMDRHLTYVAMTRHRDAVQLYADQAEFRDLGTLSVRLSRAQTKETTLDYASSGYAERRGVNVRERVADSLGDKESIHQGRGRFDGLSLGRRPTGVDRVPLSVRKAVSEQAPLEREGLHRAVERYARAWSSIEQLRRQDLPVLEPQRTALAEAGKALDAHRPGATADLSVAMIYDPGLSRVLLENQGRERAVVLVVALEKEAQMRADPAQKVERFVRVWKTMEADHNRLRAQGSTKEREVLEKQMRGLAEVLRQDRPLADILRARQQELGVVSGSKLGQMSHGQSIEQVFRERGHERGHELSR